ncbi:MAG: HAD-IA family hydrolase [Pseudomonadales bacterium]|nr:HAD-IA family hydrolase [Pseudomonadales bacterium]
MILKAVLFDLDGTLLDTQADFALVLNRLLAAEGRPAVDPQRLQENVSDGARAMLKLGFDLADDAPEFAPLMQRFLDGYEQQHSAAQLYEGVPELLAALDAAPLPWGIMTNKPRRFSRLLLPRFPSFAHCGSLVCPDDVGNQGKPNPAGLLRACSELAIAPEHCVYVGDHPRDMDAARNAGMSSIAAAWGYLPRGEKPEHWGANFVAADPWALCAYLVAMEK